MDVPSYIRQNKELYSHLNEYIESEDNDKCFTDLIKFIKDQNIFQNKEEFREFFQIIVIISINHCRKNNFIDKIEHLVLFYKNEIIQTFTNTEIFHLFKKDRKLLLFLFENKIFQFDSSIVHLILIKNAAKDNRYISYFFPEIKKFLKKETVARCETELLQIDPQIFDNFEEKRRNGESQTNLSKLIQNDSVDEFIIYTTKNCISSKSIISNSIFETNLFLLKRLPSLIEYAAFYGSLEIIRYLTLNGSILSSSLWLYAIHGRNPELIHFLEENNVEPPDGDFEICLKEALKCHHNDFADYIQFNLLKEKIDMDDPINIINDYGFKYHNYAYIPDNLDNLFLFYFACHYNFIEIVKLLYKECESFINKKANISDISIWIFIKKEFLI